MCFYAVEWLVDLRLVCHVVLQTFLYKGGTNSQTFSKERATLSAQLMERGNNNVWIDHYSKRNRKRLLHASFWRDDTFHNSAFEK